MGRIKINVAAVIELSPQIEKTNRLVSEVRINLNSTRAHVDGKILNRNNLYARLQAVSTKLASAESQISRIKSTVEGGANDYAATDVSVQLWGRTLTENLTGSGAGIGAVILAGQEAGKNDEKSDSLFRQILKDDWSLEGSVVSGKAEASSEIHGVQVSGAAEGELVGGSVKTKSKAKWDIDNKNAGIEKSIEAEGHVAKGKLSGDIGLLGGEVKGSVGNVGATGVIGASLMEDGKFTPTLKVKAKAEASVAKGDASAHLGNDEFDAHGKVSGTFLGAEAEASANAGVIKSVDKITKELRTEYGVKGKAGAEAYIAEGKASAGLKILGVKFDIGVQGKFGGAGVAAEGKITTGGVSGKVGAGLGLGAGLEFSVDWSDFSLW